MIKLRATLQGEKERYFLRYFSNNQQVAHTQNG